MTFPFQQMLPGMKVAAAVLTPAKLKRIVSAKSIVLERVKPTPAEITRVSEVTKRVAEVVK